MTEPDPYLYAEARLAAHTAYREFAAACKRNSTPFYVLYLSFTTSVNDPEAILREIRRLQVQEEAQDSLVRPTITALSAAYLYLHASICLHRPISPPSSICADCHAEIAPNL